MAFAVAYSLFNTINHILNHDEFPISVYGKQQIGRLQEKVASLLDFLEDFKEEGSRLERRIRDAANEAEDVIEHWMHEHIRSTAAGLATDVEYDLGELNMAMQEINSIAEEVEELIQPNREKLQSSPTPTPAVERMLQSSPTPTPAAVGLEKQVDLLRVWLLDYPAISISGMGGIGKTTLARAVFEDEQVVNYFHVRVWITVSQNYQIESVFEELLFSLEKQVEKGLVNECDTTEHKLSQILMNNTYLIVLDDLWSREALRDITKVIPIAENGSRIMITSREEGMVSYDSATEHKMGLMDERVSWCLLKQKVFGSRECPSELEKIGKDIAKACKGIPLAIVVAARILSQTNQTQSSWKELAPNMRSLIVEDAHFQSIIYLSYADLLHPFRSCFLYMCGFHDNYEIRASMLVKLWMAEGFAGDQSDAEFCVREIVRKNLASSTAMKGNGRIKSCIVHDLVRDVFKIKAIDENYERRFSNSHLDLREVARAYASTMRSIISFQRNESSLRGLRKFKLLRVLDVVDTDAYALPAYVFDLFHLRYLAFGCPMEVPSAISRLENLRSLIIRPRKKSKKYKYSRDEVYLPLEMWMMPLLTHLVSFFDLLPDPEGAASPLQTLVTLSVVKKLICTEEMMRLICNVKKLSITYFGERYQQDYQLQNLALLSRLEKLTLVVKEGSLLQLKAKPVFPEGLTKLTLGGWRFPWEDMKAIAALSELQVLKLRDHAFQGHTWNTNEECDEEVYDKYDGFVDKGKVFVSLGYLLIEECDIEKWDTKERHFPRLRHLVLKGCPKLNEIPSGIVCMLKLELIEVDRANVSLLKCVQENQKTRSISGRELKVGEL
ncbi:putative late blight resistance protein homolog R1B-14 [Salvia splendens]|uniref:putative late blight resistance protein homolog R1B-14 n=1 Tax=Salvia splendens TaxID=180675 RepID=UPI001C253190|nr:putative late blight resistance protein homolog R1B-14 [Salvia splendens]